MSKLALAPGECKGVGQGRAGGRAPHTLKSNQRPVKVNAIMTNSIAS